jgi:hypothetical protein
MSTIKVVINKRMNVLQYSDNGEWKTTVLSEDPISQMEHLTGKTVVDIEFVRYAWLPGYGWSDEHYKFSSN